MNKITLLLLLLLPYVKTFAQALTGDEIVVSHAVNDDLYVAGGTVMINAPIHSDLVVAGGTVVISDSISEDILVAGGKVTLHGFAGDDVRCIGGTVPVDAPISGDLIVTGGQVHIDKKTIVSGQLLCSGGEVTLDGTVRGNVKDASGRFTFNGIAEKDLECKGDNLVVNGTVIGNSMLAANAITLGSGARFDGNIRYWNKEGSFDFRPAMKGGAATYDQKLEIEDGNWRYLGFATAFMVFWYLGTALVMIALLEYLFSITFKNSADTAKTTSLKSLGLGLLFLVGAPIGILVLFASIIGLPLGLLALVGYVTIALLGTVIVSLLIANWINNTYYQSSWPFGRITITAFAIFIFLKLASLTPMVGPLVMLLLACLAFGSILQNIRWRKKTYAVR